MKKILPKGILPYLALIVTAAIWGIATPVIKLSYTDITPLAFLLYRFLLVCTLLLPYVVYRLKKDPLDKRDIPNIFLLGILGQVNLVFFFWGLNLTTALDAAIIGVSSPLLIVIAGHYFYKEEVNRMERIGIALATIGTLFIVIEPAFNGVAGTPMAASRILGNVLILLYQFSWPAYIILGRRMMGKGSRNVTKAFKFFHIKRLYGRYDPVLLTSLSFYVGLLFFIPMAIIDSSLNPSSISLGEPAVFLGVTYMAVLSSIVAYTLYQWAIKLIDVSETAVFSYLSPIFTIPAAFFMLGEVPSQKVLIGTAIIAAGIVIAEKYKS